MWTHEIKIVMKNQCPRSISHGGASLLKFSGRNSIAQFLTKTYVIHFAYYFRVVLDISLGDDLLFGMRTLLSIDFEPILYFAYAHIYI